MNRERERGVGEWEKCSFCIFVCITLSFTSTANKVGNENQNAIYFNRPFSLWQTKETERDDMRERAKKKQTNKMTKWKKLTHTKKYDQFHFGYIRWIGCYWLLPFSALSWMEWTKRMIVLSVIKFNYSEFSFSFAFEWMAAFALLLCSFRRDNQNADQNQLWCGQKRKKNEWRRNTHTHTFGQLDSIALGYYCHWLWNDYNHQFAGAAAAAIANTNIKKIGCSTARQMSIVHPNWKW